MKPVLAAIALGVATIFSTLASSADLPGTYPQIPQPSPPQQATSAGEQSGIWGAIAFSDTDGEHGFFWGADRRNEAETNALRHCERAGGDSCAVVTTFRNHRHWDDDDGSGFPYHACAALAVSETEVAGMSVWGATSAPTRKEAELVSIQACEVSGPQCKIREWVCT